MKIYYWYALLLLYDIPKIQPLPFSPRFIFIGLMGLLLIKQGSLFFHALKIFPKPLLLFFVLIFATSLFPFSLRGVLMLLEVLIAFAFITVTMQANPEKAIRFTRFLAILVLFSNIWLIGSLLLKEPFMTIRQFLYGGHLGHFNEAYLTIQQPTGLTFNHFTMGYQVVVGTVLVFSLYLADKNRWKVFWIVMLVPMLMGVFYVAERSTIPAILLPVMFIFFMQKRWKLVGLLGMIGGFFLLAMNYLPLYHETGVPTLQSRIEQTDGIKERLSWQVVAIKIIAEKPFGNLTGELDWENESLEKGADFSYYEGHIFAVHNAFLGEMLSFGWLGVILVVGTLLVISKRIFVPLLSGRYKIFYYKSYADAASLALMASMIQALFHNSSLFSLDPSSWIIFCIAMGWQRILCNEKPFKNIEILTYRRYA